LRRRAALVALGAALAACGDRAALAADALPKVASINVCADQHVLALADPEQILSISWLATDAAESLFAAEAGRYPLNYGTAEELLAFEPDVVLAGTYTSPFARSMLRRLGMRVIELEPEASVADIERNVRLVANAVGQAERGERLVAALQRDLRELAHFRPERPPRDRHRSPRWIHGRRRLACRRVAADRRPAQRRGGARPRSVG
jgi:iron complex transport system substrate-binding protein